MAQERGNRFKQFMRDPGHPVLLGTGIYALSREADTITTLLAFHKGATESYPFIAPLVQHFGNNALFIGDVASTLAVFAASGLIELGQQHVEQASGNRGPIRWSFAVPALISLTGWYAAGHNILAAHESFSH